MCEITWFRCLIYRDAVQCGNAIIYLFERNGAPSYWGHASNFQTRYNAGYDHLIEDCLHHGGRLYIGKIKNRGRYSLQDVEDELIKRYGSEWNSPRKRRGRRPVVKLTHAGNVPESIERGYPMTTRVRR